MTTITHINPPTLHTSPAFSQAVLASGGQTLYVGGQNGTTADGTLVEGYGEQTKQALRNITAILAEVGAEQSDVVKLTIHIVEGQDANEGYAASAEVWTARTAVTVVTVSAVGRPGALVEIDAIAVV